MTLQQVVKLLYSASERIGLSLDERHAILQAAATLDHLRGFATLYADKEMED